MGCVNIRCLLHHRESHSGYGTGTYVLSLSEVDPSVIPFDHPSGAEAATPIEVGERLEGRGNHETDIDMFSFMAKEGGAYQIELTPRDATQVGFWVYGQSDGIGRENTAESQDGGAASLQFVASSSGTHFIAVIVDADTLAYTLTVTEIDPGQVTVDHGDDFSSASRLAVGKSVEGVVDGEEDADYFSFLAEEGEAYWISLTPGMDAEVGFAIHDLNFVEIHVGTAAILWTAPHAREYFIVVVAVSESGTYTLTVTQETE